MEPSTTLIVGTGGRGKTRTLLYEVIEKERPIDYLLILFTTIWINKIYPDWKYLESDIDVTDLEITSDKLNVILKRVIDIYSGARTAVIIDDMCDSTEQHISHNVSSYLGYSSRHPRS